MAGVAIWNLGDEVFAPEASSVFHAEEAAMAALNSFSKHGVAAAHNQLRRHCAAMESSSKHQGTFRSCLPSYMDRGARGLLHSMAPLTRAAAELRRVGLVDLELDRPSAGCVLHGFLQVEAFRCSNVAVTAVEDDTGRMARLLALNSLFWNSSQEEVARMYPQGAEVLVAEPCLIDAEFCHGRALVVSNPLALEVVSYFPWIEVGEPDVFLGLGSKELDERKNFRAAVDLFTRCLERLEQDDQIDEKRLVLALARRAEAWIKLERYESALNDADKALAVDPSHEKSLLARGLALLGLRQYESSSSCFQKVVKRSSSDHTQRLKEFHDVSLRFKEQSSRGTYDLSDYYLGGIVEESAPEIADYVGPVEIRMTRDGRGRGLFLTKDIAMGELVLVSNAVALVFPDDECPALKLDTFGTLLTAVLNACMASPRTLAQVYSLAESDPESGRGLVKEDIPDMRLFLPNTPLDLQQQNRRQQELDLDVCRIANILHCVNENGRANADALVARDFDGLWTLPGFINHSCLPNVGVHRVGKALVVVAARDLKSGSELLRSYGSALAPWNPMRRDSVKLECRCERCDLEQRLERELDEISERYDAALRASSMLESEFHELLAGLAVELERKLAMPRLGLRETDKQWLRTSYCVAYLSYYAIAEKPGKGGEAMPSRETTAAALQASAPGFSKTLMTMCCFLDSGQSQELLQKECVSLCGRQRCEVVAAIIEQARRDGKISFW